MSDVLLEKLLQQAYLFDDPGAYAAGVRDAWTAVAATVTPATDDAAA